MSISMLKSNLKDFESILNPYEVEELHAALALVNNEKKVRLNNEIPAHNERPESNDLPRIMALVGLLSISVCFIYVALGSGKTSFFVWAAISGVLAGLTLVNPKRYSNTTNAEYSEHYFDYLSDLSFSLGRNMEYNLHGKYISMDEIWKWRREIKEVDTLRKELLSKSPLIRAHLVLMSALRSYLIFKSLNESSASISK